MNLLFILENYYPNIGGVETLFKSLCENLVTKGHSITILTNKFDSKLSAKEEINGVKIIRLPFKNRYFFTFFSMFHCVKYARNCDLIHTTSYNACFPAFFAGLFTRKKVIITFHEVWGKLWFSLPYFGKLTLWLHYAYEQFILKLPFYRFIAVSDYTSNALQYAGIKATKIHRIYNGIDYSEFQSDLNKTIKTNDEFKFCFFGRLGISKGIDILLEAVSLITKDNFNFKLNMIIPTEPADMLEWVNGLILKHQISDYIILEHELSFEHLKNRIQDSDAVIIPSASEGFCFAAVESIALGASIISSGKGALKEVVSGQYVIFNPYDAQGLYSAMVKALNNEWKNVPIKKFKLSESIDAYEKFYKSILKDEQ